MSKKSFRVCVNTQTPLVRFNSSYSDLLEKYGNLPKPLDLNLLTEGEDYQFTTGGVTAMVYSLVKKMTAGGIIREAKWVSLNPAAPPSAKVQDIELRHVTLEEQDIPLYTNFKEGVWRGVHGLGHADIDNREYEAYATYNWRTSKLLMSMIEDVDLYWVHDFQQLQVGNMIGPAAPTALRWHIPFALEKLSKRMANFVSKNIEDYDVVVVSTRRDLEGLIRAGYRGRAHQIYPHVDPSIWKRQPESARQSLANKLGIKPNDIVLLIVGRMDRIKSQDVAIKAVAKARKRFPNLKLLLVGNGSFTSSRVGGLSHPKGHQWRDELLALVRELGLGSSVILTGYLSHNALRSAYALAHCVLVTSRVEGFNLSAVEGWLYGRPAIVSRGAGSSELVIDGSNGYTFDGRAENLSDRLEQVLSKPEEAEKMGKMGAETAKQCYVEVAVQSVRSVFEDATKSF